MKTNAVDISLSSVRAIWSSHLIPLHLITPIIMVRTTYHEAPRYRIFSRLLLPPPYAHVSTSEQHFRRLSAYAFPFMWQTKSYTCSSVPFNLYVFAQ